MKKKVWIWILSIIVVLAIGVTVFFTMNKGPKMADNPIDETPVMVQKAKEEELIETILVTGKIVPEDEQKVFLEPEKGEISEYKVEENQKVKAGDPLFIYDSSKLKTQFNRAVRERDLIQSRAKTEQNQIAELNKKIAETKKKVGVPQKVKSDDPEAEDVTIIPVTQDDVNQLMNDKIQLEIQYEGTKAEIEGAQEQINEIDAQIKAMTVTSKIDGIIVKINKNTVINETGANEPVIHITSSEPFKVIGTMSEFDTVKIQKDQAVVVRPKVYKDREWKGVVESVSQFPNDEGGGGDFGGGMGGGNVTMYPFKVAITDDTSELRQGFHVSLEVKISGGGKSLVVPHMAIVDEDGMSLIYVLNDGKLERREIQTGKMNDEFIEVTDGVSLGELVVTMPFEGMHDGMEVASYDEVK
ncbi:efflux RND transporter periplasmic adaptor subunit [Lederbergia wuyishanensis]|uniref:Multidrug efflux pump subunit AcrA (Membrane-fusion protein) n=1 Tax=Lederbergia wuyishanensis TaxID=1347903 RepID=A0ABU0D5N3_9BACI|nr:biotin/lipoyl-binding protein [Lederbergia wuyishanensis]MCJ8008306.1 HlyD family efflux transporter periplasmic adaptor subunit [Lederbergia wuyishanensis]MDQ0343718.1 multidrug efflux pump subunit AcrA (membrane-fusion protein) [Lederbergia wuyishanensis]